jgi:hypothetical protein
MTRTRFKRCVLWSPAVVVRAGEFSASDAWSPLRDEAYLTAAGLLGSYRNEISTPNHEGANRGWQ